MNKIIPALSLTATLFSAQIHSEEKYSHFPAIASTDLPNALCNINAYNEKLSAILSQSALTAQDMVKVHELTYTLENAVNYLKASLEQASIDLEKVHKASEILNERTIIKSGKRYLDSTTLLANSRKCD
jgi:hypothetical protein